MAHAPSHAGLGPRFPHVLAAATAAAIDAIVCGGGALLAVRRLTADWHPSHGPAALVAVCLGGGLLVAAGDVARHACGHPPSRLARLGLILAAAAVAIPLPVHSAGQGVLAVLAFVGAGAVVARPWVSGRKARIIRNHGRRAPRGVERPVVAAQPVPAPFASEVTTADVPGQVLHQLTRFTRADGVECVQGRLYLAVPAGVRSSAGHIGFCPPFPQVPAVEVTTDYDAVEALVAAAEVLPWGVRIECRLDEPADDAFEIPIDFTAEAAAVGPST